MKSKLIYFTIIVCLSFIGSGCSDKPDNAKTKDGVSKLKLGSEDKILETILNGSNGSHYPLGRMPANMLPKDEAKAMAAYVAKDLSALKATKHPELVKQGKTLWPTCAACHGNDGKGMDGNSPDLTTYGSEEFAIVKHKRKEKIRAQRRANAKAKKQANGKMSDMEYECKKEENSYTCVKIGLERLQKDTLSKLWELKTELLEDTNLKDDEIQNELSMKLVSAYIDGYKNLSDYCYNQDYIFFEDKKEKKLDKKACKALRNGMESQLLKLFSNRVDETTNQKIKEKIKTASQLYTNLAIKGCELDDFNSCEDLFYIFHPQYNPYDALITKVIKKYVNQDIDQSLEYLDKACKIDKSKHICKKYRE